MWCGFPSSAYISWRLDPTVPSLQGIMNPRCVRAKLTDDYRLPTAFVSWITTPQLWDTTIPAQAWNNPSHSVEPRLGPDYTIDTSLGNPFYLYPIPRGQFEAVGRYPRGRLRILCRGQSVPLIIRYGDLVKLASVKKLRTQWGVWESLTIPIEPKSDIRKHR